MRVDVRVSLLPVLLGAAGCDEYAKLYPTTHGIFSESEWREIEMLSPIPELPSSPTNAHADDQAAAALGQMLFFETEYAGSMRPTDADGNPVGPDREGTNCASCHHVDDWFQQAPASPDERRDVTSALNIGHYSRWFTWDGRRDSLWSLSLMPIEGAPMDSDRITVVRVVLTKYRAEYLAAFGELPELLAGEVPSWLATPGRRGALKCDGGRLANGAWDSLALGQQDAVNRVFANVGKAFEAYLRRLQTGEAPFDRFVAGDDGAIGESAKRGLALFVGSAGCVRCHAGPMFTDESFHVVGSQPGAKEPEGRACAVDLVVDYEFNSVSEYSDDPDYGMGLIGGLETSEEFLGQFRTPSLRNVAQTAPYMYAGQYATLEEVIDLYHRGGGGDYMGLGEVDDLIHPLALDERDVDDLVAFLGTLTGEAPPAELLVDTSKP